MFTLIGLGTGAAYSDSVAATLFPWIFPFLCAERMEPHPFISKRLL